MTMMTPTTTTTTTTTTARPWLFSPTLDVVAFVGSVLISVGLVGLAVLTGDLPLGTHDDDVPLPEWLWIATVLLVDVAHVWGTAVLIYLDPVERRRRPLLYGLVPIGALILGAAIASESELLWWRLLAYVAVWHFARQQVGFVRLYRGRAAEQNLWGQLIDEGAVYAATLGPVVWWHSRLPVSLHWFIAGDFVVGVPLVVGDVVLVGTAVWLMAYAVRALSSARQRRQWGRHLLVATTALVWGGGIVAWGNDLVFTVTNVVAHGLPYVVLVCWTAWRRRTEGVSLSQVARAGAGAIVVALWAFAFVEEVLWDRLIHHERPWLEWAPAVVVGDWRPVLVALLSVPQVTHYVLDGVYWKRRHHRGLAESLPGSSSTTA